MRTRVVARGAIGAAAILLGLSVQASAQSTSQPPAGSSYQYNSWNSPDASNWNNNWNANSWNNNYATGSYDSGYYGQYDQGATGWRGYAPADYSAYGAGNYYGSAPYYGAYPGGPVQAGADIAGNVVTGAGEMVGGTVGAVGSAFGAPNYSGPAYAQQQDSQSYCAARFRSYDPASGTYLGRDGRRHACP